VIIHAINETVRLLDVSNTEHDCLFVLFSLSDNRAVDLVLIMTSPCGRVGSSVQFFLVLQRVSLVSLMCGQLQRCMIGCGLLSFYHTRATIGSGCELSRCSGWCCLDYEIAFEQGVGI
jgi:hypothetical protein